MKCPICNDKELKREILNGVHVEKCESCEGIWLDKGELNEVAHHTTGDIEYCSHDVPGSNRPTELVCPYCMDENLNMCNFIEFTNIVFDYCPKCEGIWLNKGDLQKINQEIDNLEKESETGVHKFMVFLANLPF